MSADVELVEAFIRAWSRLDADELADYFADDGVYHNMPLEPVSGRDAVRDFIRKFLTTWTATEWEILNITANDKVIMAERVDRTRTTQGNIDLPCVGVFEIVDGKIKTWRDYFDMAAYTQAMRGDGA